MTEPGERTQSPGGPDHDLACGASTDELLEQVADGHAAALTDHQSRCPHCQAAIRELAAVWEPVRLLAAEPVAVPAALKASVANQIRKLAADIWYTLQLEDGGALRIAARVVAKIAREAARTVPGVRIAFGRSSQGKMSQLIEKATLGHRHPHAAVGVLGRTAVIELAVAVQYGQELDTVARQVQQRAISELRATTGLRDVAVNVTIDDVIT